MSARARPESPFAATRFLLELEGSAVAGFASCRGLGEEREVLSYAEGGFNGTRFFAGSRRAGPLSLERGLTRDRSLREWFERGDRRAGAVLVLDEGGEVGARFEFHRAWPSAWKGPELDASGAFVALERIELVCEEVRWSETE